MPATSRSSDTARLGREGPPLRRLRGRPHPLLRSAVPKDYGAVTAAAGSHRVVLPATSAVPLVVKLADSAYRPPQFVAGAHGAVQRPEGACAPSYLEVWLAPVHAFTILDVPLYRLGDETVDLLDVLGLPGRRLGDRLRDAPSWSQRWALLDHFLIGRLQAGPAPAPEVRHTWRRLVASGGAVPIATLVAETGWSHKHLISRFRQQIGLPPKRAAALLRFETVLRRLQRDATPDWSLLAAETGYADQAHLVRDFHRFSGTTPTGFLTRSHDLVRHPAV
jgi:AraC-like DNA-binding protein